MSVKLKAVNAGFNIDVNVNVNYGLWGTDGKAHMSGKSTGSFILTKQKKAQSCDRA